MTAVDPLDRHPMIRASRRVVTQQLRDSTRLIDRAVDGLEAPPVEGSGRARLLEWCHGLPATTDAQTRYRDAATTMLIQGTESVAHLLMSAGDHARALESALDDRRGLRASVNTLLRGCLEAALQVSFLADPNVPPHITVLRACAFQLAAAEGSEATAAAFAAALSSTERLAQTREAVDGIHGWFEDAGFERQPDTRNPRRSTNISYDGIRVNLEFDVTAATKRYLPQTDYIYGVLSGAAHSRGWFLASVYDVTDGAEVTSLPDVFQAAALAGLTIADAVTKTLCGHFGFQVDPYLKETHKRRHMLVRVGDPQRGDLVADYRSFHDPNFVQPHVTAGFGRPTGSASR